MDTKRPREGRDRIERAKQERSDIFHKEKDRRRAVRVPFIAPLPVAHGRLDPF